MYISQKEKTDLIARVKSSIARQVWRNQGYYQSINIEDNVIKKAMEIIVK